MSSLTKVQKRNGPSTPPMHIARENKIKEYFINPDLKMMKDDTETFIVAFYNNESADFSLDYIIKNNGIENNDFDVELYRIEILQNISSNYYDSQGDLDLAGYYLDPLLSYEENELIYSAESVFWWVTIDPKKIRHMEITVWNLMLKQTGSLRIEVLILQFIITLCRGRSALQFYLGMKFFEESEGKPGYMTSRLSSCRTD